MNIQEIIIQTNNLSETMVFYSQVMGMNSLKERELSVSFPAGSSILTFQESDAVKHPTYHFAFNIPENQIQDAIKWAHGKVELLQVTAKSKIADYQSWNAHAIYFTDNNGNVVELIARHDLKNASTAAFTATAIECISEIGIVTKEVNTFTDELIEAYDLSLFSKQPRQANFAALGDDHGLFIIVGNDRCWFPTTIPSEKYPLKIIIGDEASKMELAFN
jgi:catechol-2,3-dioxygenase